MPERYDRYGGEWHISGSARIVMENVIQEALRAARAERSS